LGRIPLAKTPGCGYPPGCLMETAMSINSERDIEANLQIGPTDKGMVRLYIEAQGVEIPMDFTPEEADEIAAEIIASAEIARGTSS